MNDAPKGNRFRPSAAMIAAVATLITALTGMYVAFRESPETTDPVSTPPVTEPQPTAETETLTDAQARRTAERLTSSWMAAFRAGDIDSLMSVSGVPFFLDDTFFTTPGDLRDRYSEMAASRESEQLPPPDRILSYSLAEYEQLGFAEGDRIVGRLQLADNDLVVGVFFGDEGVAFFFKNLGSTLELVGFWD